MKYSILIQLLSIYDTIKPENQTLISQVVAIRCTHFREHVVAICILTTATA
jgi:hypothetical protein